MSSKPLNLRVIDQKVNDTMGLMIFCINLVLIIDMGLSWAQWPVMQIVHNRTKLRHMIHKHQSAYNGLGNFCHIFVKDVPAHVRKSSYDVFHERMHFNPIPSHSLNPNELALMWRKKIGANR